MARSRRRSFSNRGRSRSRQPMLRRKLDWVYRPNYRQDSVQGFDATDLLGTYDPDLRTYLSGVANSGAWVLYDSQNRLINVMRGGSGSNLAAIMPNAARAEGRNTYIHSVRGTVYIEPTTWALGNLIAWGFRIGIFEQDPESGAMLFDPAYSMWVSAGGGITVANWANMGRQNLWERRVHFGFSDNQRFTVMGVQCRVNRVLQPHECLGVYFEGESTSVNVRCQTWLRTLAAQPG